MSEKVRVLIASGILSPMHDGRSVNKMLAKTLEASEHFTVDISEESRGLNLEAFNGYELVLINYDGIVAESVTDRASLAAGRSRAVPLGAVTENALYDYVNQGGGVIFYHSSVLVGGRFSEKYRSLIGCVNAPDKYQPYRDTGYTVDVNKACGHTITEGVEEHWKLCDDDFFNSIELDNDCEIIASIYDPLNKRDVPVMWVKQVGKGRVFSVTLGHQQDTIRRLDFVRLIIRAADWAAHGVVTVPMPDRDSGVNWMKSWPWYFCPSCGRENWVSLGNMLRF